MSKSRNQIRDEMTGLLMRGGLIGLVAFAAAVAFMAIPRQIGRIWPTETVQTGFRGTGMDVISFQSANAAAVAANAAPAAAFPPQPPVADEALAGASAANADPLGHLTLRNYNRLVEAMREWVGHADLFAEEETYTTAVARSMIAMTWAINDEWDVHVGATGVTCWTCHRGNNVPTNVWTLPQPLNSWAGPSAMFQNQATPANYSTALPVDALQRFLLESDQAVGVHGTTPRNPGEAGASILATYQTFSLMQHFSNALGVNCTYCHNTRAFAELDQATPQWSTAQIGRAMVQDINNTWILPITELLPAERLGPAGDAPKVSCATCHQGAAKPLLGQSMLADWPELAGPEPVYQ
jgi:photosynthetic reaction center cytochrome c subunit